jgi:hypothetical protein
MDAARDLLAQAGGGARWASAGLDWRSPLRAGGDAR